VLDLQVKAEKLEEQLTLLTWALYGFEVLFQNKELVPFTTHVDRILAQTTELGEGLAALTKVVARAEDAARATVTT
jgi:hypothetical protein